MSDDYQPVIHMPKEIQLVDDDAVLARTQNVRDCIVKNFITPERGVTRDPDELQLLLKTMSDMDRAALGNKRIKADEKSNDINAEAARGIAMLLEKAAGQKAFRSDGAVSRSAPTLGEDFPDPETVPGELDSNPAPLTYNNFMAQNSKPEETK